MTLRFIGREAREFRVGHASRPLGGHEGWIDSEVVPLVAEVYEERGWTVVVEPRALVFKLPEDM